MPCATAVMYSDTREIWRQQLYPNLTRLAFGSDFKQQRLSVEGESNQPKILVDIFRKNENSWWPQNNDVQVLKNFKKSKCLVIQNTSRILRCGQNVTSEISENPNLGNPFLQRNPGSMDQL